MDTNADAALEKFKASPIAVMKKFGDNVIMSHFNFQEKVDGKLAWEMSFRSVDSQIPFVPGETSALDLIRSYIESVDSPDDDLLQNYADAKLVLRNTHKPSDLTFSAEMGVVDLDQDGGWGGRGNITLIGDAAHSLRPVSGLGGSLAFEDAALLSRAICSDEDGDGSAMESRLRDFEARRLPRCKSLSRDQTIRAKLVYKLGFGNVPQWDPRYQEWTFAGPDAPPEPPVCELDVFGTLLETI